LAHTIETDASKRLPLFAAVALAHVFVIAIIIASSQFQVLLPATMDRQELVLLDLRDAVRTQAMVKSIVSRSVSRIATRPPATPPPKAGVVAPAPARTHAGPIDWAAEARQVVRNSIEREARGDPYRSFSIYARGIDVPDRDATQRRGDSQRFEGGEVISWISDRCFYTNRGWDPFTVIPQAQLLCKDPPRRN
jgi:hypothetical protein